MNEILQNLGSRLVFFDGAMGTQLQAKGLPPGYAPELWNLERPETIRAVHTAYLEAGAQVLKSNTFGANPIKCRELGVSAAQLVAAGVTLAREAAAQSGKQAAVALDMGPTGKLLAPMGDLPFEEAVAAFGEMVEAGAAAGADCVLIETMSDLYEVKAAVLAAKERASLPVYVTMTFDETGKLLTGGSLEAAVAVLEGLGVDALGLNCGLGPKQMLGLTRRLAGLSSLPVIVNPNAGLPTQREGKTCYDVGPEEFGTLMAEIVQAGAQAVGGCCGTTPEHLAQVVEKCSPLPCPPVPRWERTVVASGIQAVEFGGKPVLIGERINPTGKSRLKQALREKDMAYLLGEGIAQQDAGAHVLDVNVGLPEIDEPSLMCQVIGELQGVSPLPLQIDTADPETMERAMRLYNGKALVNSVTAKEASMEAIFPLVKRYGGVVVGLTICLAIYAIFPNGQLLRRPIVDDDILSRLVILLRKADTPTNVCPSIHVFMTVSIALASARSRALSGQVRRQAALMVLSVLICLSTVFLKQHSVVDVACGTGLSLALDTLLRRTSMGMGTFRSVAPRKNTAMES